MTNHHSLATSWTIEVTTYQVLPNLHINIIQNSEQHYREINLKIYVTKSHLGGH